MPQVCSLGSYIGISQRAEIIFMLALSIVCNFFDKSPLEIGTNIKKVWNLNLNDDIFSEYTQQNLKSLIAGIVAVRSLTVQTYIVCSFLLFYPLLIEDKAWFCYPWLIISAMKNLGTSFLSLTVGLFVCATYGACKPACVIFSLEQIIDIIPSLYMWMKVMSFCRELRKPKIMEFKLPEEIEELETLTAIRRRMARSMTTETVLREQIERRRRIGNSALGMVDIFKPHITHNIVSGSKSLDTLLDNIANDEYYEVEDDYVSLEGLKPSQITMKLLGITESQIEAAKRSKINGNESKSEDNVPKLKIKYHKSTRLSDCAPCCSKLVKTKLFVQSSLYNIPQRIIRRTKSDVDIKRDKNEPLFLNDVEEKEITAFVNNFDDDQDKKKSPNQKKNSTNENFNRNETIDILYDLKNISGYKLQKLKSFLNTPLRKCTFLNKIKHELIEQMFIDNKTEMKKFEKIFEIKDKMRSSTDIGLQENYGLDNVSLDSFKNYSQTSYKTEIKDFSINIKKTPSGVISETTSDIIYNKFVINEVNDNENLKRRPFTEQIDSVKKNIIEAQKLLIRIGDENVRDLCNRLLEAVKNLKYEKKYEKESNFLHSVSRYNLLKDLLKILNEENNMANLEKRRAYNFENNSIKDIKKNNCLYQKDEKDKEVLELHSKTNSEMMIKANENLEEVKLEPKRKLVENFYLDNARIALFAELKSKFEKMNELERTELKPDSGKTHEDTPKYNSFGFKLQLSPDTIDKYMDKINPGDANIEITLEKRTSNFYGFPEKHQPAKKLVTKKKSYEFRCRLPSYKKGSNPFISKVPLRTDTKPKKLERSNTELKLPVEKVGSNPFVLKFPHAPKYPKKISKSISHDLKKQTTKIKSFASNKETKEKTKNLKPNKIHTELPNPFRLKFPEPDPEVEEKNPTYNFNTNKSIPIKIKSIPKIFNNINELERLRTEKPKLDNKLPVIKERSENLHKSPSTTTDEEIFYLSQTDVEDSDTSLKLPHTSNENKQILPPKLNVSSKNLSGTRVDSTDKWESGKENQQLQNKINTTDKKTKRIEPRRKSKTQYQKIQKKKQSKPVNPDNKKSVQKITSGHTFTIKTSPNTYIKSNTYSQLYAKSKKAL